MINDNYIANATKINQMLIISNQCAIHNDLALKYYNDPIYRLHIDEYICTKKYKLKIYLDINKKSITDITVLNNVIVLCIYSYTKYIYGTHLLKKLESFYLSYVSINECLSNKFAMRNNIKKINKYKKITYPEKIIFNYYVLEHMQWYDD